MAGLSVKQQKFIDEYIISGNATDAYKKAGYAWKSENTAGANGHKLLKNHKIATALKERSESISNSKIMDQQEVMERYTAIARGEPKKAVYREKLTVKGETFETIKEYEHSPSFEEVNKALEQVGKRYAMWTDKQEITGDIAVTFVDDIGSELDDS